VGKTVAIIGAGGIGFDVGTHSQKVSVLLNWLCELSINLTIEKSVDIKFARQESRGWFRLLQLVCVTV